MIRTVAASVLSLSFGVAGLPTAAHTQAKVAVEIEGGNIVLTKDGSRTPLTDQARDSEAVLSPDGQWVYFTRTAEAGKRTDDDEFPDCTALSTPDELRRIRIDGGDDTLLMTGRPGTEPTDALCGFFDKQFSADGGTLYFLSPAWTTSAALHAMTLENTSTRYIIPANAYAVLSWCTSEKLAGAIVAEQHRYFELGGSFDWYWLFDGTGSKEIGPVGEFDSVDDLKTFLNEGGHCTGS
ncbi:hypothetical protein W911_16980 [Hyphomicrobium nitrativorans NL23]|uniref:Uncharacterized protein n=1 Tax=Hyphomicrobium nitrativorans NL23 TaxID=1029756 RepID=V5SIY0_9HYPH|nr:PD40 domain-containing protein [Hyphomicrobium nitrativorans]AHB50452.1 hypothetical protein W911_16980 [Hyphomicrobium nitrativorans NL23]